MYLISVLGVGLIFVPLLHYFAVSDIVLFSPSIYFSVIKLPLFYSHRLNRQRSSTKLRQDLISDQSTNTGLGENFKGFSHSFWAFTKSQLTQSLTKLPDHDEKLGLQVFSTILVFSGLIQGIISLRILAIVNPCKVFMYRTSPH